MVKYNGLLKRKIKLIIFRGFVWFCFGFNAEKWFFKFKKANFLVRGGVV